MIDRAHRFHGHSSLRGVYQRGQTWRGAFLMLRVLPNSRRSTFRLAIVVSRKVSKSAVVRNRIRRRLYEVVRTQQPFIKQPFDLVITVFSAEIATQPYDQLTSAVTQLLQKAQVIPGEASAPTPPRDIVNAKERKI